MKKVLLCLAIAFTTTNGHAQTNEISEKFGITLSVPIVNKMQYYDHYYTKNAYRTRYGGISGGVYVKPNGIDKISLLGGVAVGDYKKIYDLSKVLYTGPDAHDLNVLFFDAMYHKKVFNMVYALGGLNFSRYKYRYRTIESSTTVSHSDKTLGVLAGVEFQPLRFLSTSIVYRPAIISFDQKAPYHYISFDLRFHIPFYTQSQRQELGRIRDERTEERKKRRPQLPFTNQ